MIGDNAPPPDGWQCDPHKPCPCFTRNNDRPARYEPAGHIPENIVLSDN